MTDWWRRCGELTPFRFGSRARLKKGFVHLPKQLITKALLTQFSPL